MKLSGKRAFKQREYLKQNSLGRRVPGASGRTSYGWRGNEQGGR